MKDKLDELHYIYKMIGNYGFCTVQELLDKYNGQKERIEYLERNNNRREDTILEQRQRISNLEDKLSKIETLIINHNCDTGDIYYKYNNKFLKSELKQRILEIVYEQGSDNNGRMEN